MSSREWGEGTIRDAVADDAAGIARVHVVTWQAAYRGHMPDDYLQALDPSKREALWGQRLAQPGRGVFVAVHDSRIVGFCSFLSKTRDTDAAPTTGEISAIYVEPARWRGGCGSALLRRVVAHATELGFEQLTLWVLTGNDRARAFYEQHGFVPDGAKKTEPLPGFTVEEVRYRLIGMARPRA